MVGRLFTYPMTVFLILGLLAVNGNAGFVQSADPQAKPPVVAPASPAAQAENPAPEISGQQPSAPAAELQEDDKDAAEKPLEDAEEEVAEEKASEEIAGEEKTAEEKTAEEKTAEEEKAAADSEETARLASEHLLPVSTQLFISIPDMAAFHEHFEATQLGELAREPALKPFIDSFRVQIENWLNEKNVRLGAKVDDIQEFKTGEICIAGVLEKEAGGLPLGRGSHGMILLIDVASEQEKAVELLKRIDAEFKTRGGVRSEKNINGNLVTIWTVDRPHKVVDKRSTHYIISGGWLLASDNESIFRNVLARLANQDAIKEEETLASQKPFQAVMANTRTESIHTDLRWYVNPFGYIELGQAIEAEEQSVRQAQDTWAQELRDEGFDALGGVGGQISFATGDHEVLHRTFVHAPQKELNDVRHKRVFSLIDFTNHDNRSLDPPEWIPANASAYSTGIWDMSKALSNVGYFVDMFAGEDAFAQALETFKSDMNLDVPIWVSEFENQIIMMSSSEQPIGENSERIAFFLPIKPGSAGTMLENVQTIVGGEDVGRMFKLAGFDALEVNNSNEPIEDFGGPPDIFLNVGDDARDLNQDQDPNGNVSEEFRLFEKSYYVIYKDHLVVANDKTFLKKILSTPPSETLGQSQDYIRVSESLEALTDTDRISLRQFSRIDRQLETNYEMLRTGKMSSSQTILARILNSLLKEQGQALTQRDQKLDGTQLPEDYDNTVGCYLGPTGLVSETLEDGWRLTGVMLKKKELSEMVQKPGDGDKALNR